MNDAPERKEPPKDGIVQKIVVNLGAPLLIAAVSPLLAIWVMVQLKLVAFSDLTTKSLPMATPAAATAPQSTTTP